LSSTKAKPKKSKVATDEVPVKPEGQEVSEELSKQTSEESAEAKNRRIELLESEHMKAKRRKRGNNTQ
jgi:hypothetical protein